MPISDASGLELHLGYSFRDKNLLMEALTHKSFHHENPETQAFHNERLEFLGDSVLALVVVEYLFGKEGRHPESMMSKLKSYIVKSAVLSEAAKNISLGTYLRIGKGEEKTGGRHKRSVIANALEAVLGAVYMDGGIDSARKVILRLFKGMLDDLIESGDFYDYKSELQEQTQMAFGILPEYRLVAETGQEHKKVFEVEVFIKKRFYGRGTGKTKKEGEAQAAKDSLSRLRGGH